MKSRNFGSFCTLQYTRNLYMLNIINSTIVETQNDTAAATGFTFSKSVNYNVNVIFSITKNKLNIISNVTKNKLNIISSITQNKLNVISITNKWISSTINTGV